VRIEPDAWLAQIFGYPVFKLVLSESAEMSHFSRVIRERLQETSPGIRAFCYAKVPSDRVDIVSALSAEGFSVVDVSVTFEREGANESVDPAPCGVVVRDAEARDEESVLDMAATCFRYSRFHLDPLIPNRVANLVKREWVRNYLLGKRGERLLLAEVDGRPAGFLCVLSVGGEDRKTGVIDLVGVGQAHQRKGVGKALLDFFRASSFRRYQRLRVGTQAANIPSMGLYQSCDYRVRETAYVLHAHIEGS